MLEKELLLYETAKIPRAGEYVSIGIPLAKGELTDQTELTLSNQHKLLQPLQTEALKHWPDGSIKWLLLDFAATVPAGGCEHYRLASNPGQRHEAGPAVQVIPASDHWLVRTGSADFSLDAKEFRPFSSIRANGREILLQDGSFCLLDLNGKGSFAPAIESITIETAGPLRATLKITGAFPYDNGLSPRFSSRLHFFANSSRVMLEFTILNPKPAQHLGGFWDLGDTASLIIRDLSLKLRFSKEFVKTISCSPKQGGPSFCTKEKNAQLSIYQESSGGQNWQSPLHRNWLGEVPLTFSGFKCKKNGEAVLQGDRATPLVWCGDTAGGVAVTLPSFWQEFPKAVEADHNALQIALFPGCFPDLHELQGGEQKTTTIQFDFSSSPEGFEWARTPLTILAAPEVYQQSRVIPDLPVTANKNGEGDLIDLYLKGPEQLLEKRELIDEFGWRNFGEVYADHESVYHQGPEAFISHYSNQYDLCAGMYRKCFATGIPLWGELAADLAHHLLDIDIYHTEHDREEYNNGLFWHTDHYIPAGLATHRSFSREHLQAKNPLFCGGGPGAEHCYTTGLLLHYFLTGNRDYQQAVVKLANWCLRSLTGSQTMLATAKKASRYIRQLWRTSADSNTPFPNYPLTRGTGNAITACLDAFEAIGDRWFLEQAELLIQGSLHPADDITARDLLNPEDAWSYTVLLGAVVKYLDKKNELGDLDDQFCYARSCLQSYADWMLQHEYPYLDKPEILEYPNETWPAQDLRKSVILFHASRYDSSERREALLEKARFFYTTARDELNRHATSSFTRPVALMLQNGWVGTQLDAPVHAPVLPPVTGEISSSKATPALTIWNVIQRVHGELRQAVGRFSLKDEIKWLRLRLQNLRYSP